MIPDLLVYIVIGLTAAYVVAWALSPRLRAAIERPKHLFLDQIRRYDRRDHD